MSDTDEKNIKDPDDQLLDESFFEYEEELPDDDFDIDEERLEGFTGHAKLDKYCFPDWD